MKTECKNCGLPVEYPDESSGQTVDCPDCKAALYLPKVKAEAPPQLPVSTVNVSYLKTLNQEAKSNRNLKSCPACGNSVSRSAAVCPRCGHHVGGDFTTIARLIFGLCAAALLLWFCWGLYTMSK